MNQIEPKGRLRAEAAARRPGLQEGTGPNAGERVRDRFIEAIRPPSGAVIGGYWPMRDELDVTPLLRHLHDCGHVCVLPVVIEKRAPLAFRTWRPGARLIPGPFGVHEPGEDCPEARPEIALVPMLAFDRSGHRLGYGAGHYDRTLRALRRTGSIIAVGIAFEGQSIEAVPHDAADEPLDWVVTEAGAIKCGT